MANLLALFRVNLFEANEFAVDTWAVETSLFYSLGLGFTRSRYHLYSYM